MKLRKRPDPPHFDPMGAQFFAPAPEVLEWVEREILAADGTIHNPDHAHLMGADLCFLWAANGFTSKQRTVVGTAEQVVFRCNAWQKIRQEQQLAQWFGKVPEFLITLDANYAAQASDADWCALVEHELYHVTQRRDEFGMPLFSKATGQPKLCIQGHDFEQFVGVVERYGMGDSNDAFAKAVKAANRGPTIGVAAIAGACGTCMLKLA